MLKHPRADRSVIPHKHGVVTTGAVAVLLIIAFAIGGGGSRFGIANLVVQLVALAVLTIHRREFFSFWTQAPFAICGLVAATILLPLLQIIPLPPSVWTALPGRELVVQSLDLVGGVGWFPYSVDPIRTLLALTALIAPIVVVTIGWSLPRERLLIVCALVVALGCMTVLIGSVQMTVDGNFGSFFADQKGNPLLIGTFANRNSTGLLLIFALALAATLPAPKPHPAVLPVRLAICALLLLAVILTRSRTALVLAAVPVALGILRTLWWRPQTQAMNAGGRQGLLARPIVMTLAIFGLGAVTIATVLVAAPTRVRETLERFEATDDARRFIWDDAIYSASRYWPAGAGMGTFDEVFQVDESLENLTVRRAGRAHSDILELTIEAGLPGLALAVLWIALIGWLSWQARRSPLRWVAWSGTAFMLTIALQSITDYPLRNQTLLALSGFAFLLLARIASDKKAELA